MRAQDDLRRTVLAADVAVTDPSASVVIQVRIVAARQPAINLQNIGDLYINPSATIPRVIVVQLNPVRLTPRPDLPANTVVGIGHPIVGTVHGEMIKDLALNVGRSVVRHANANKIRVGIVAPL